MRPTSREISAAYYLCEATGKASDYLRHTKRR